MGTRTGAKETRKGGERDGLKQVGRFTDESGIWNGASAAAGLSRPYRIEWLRSNGVTTAPKRGSKLRSRSKEVTPSIGGGDIIRIPDGGEKKRKKLFLLPIRPKNRDVDSSIRAGFCRRIGTNRIAIKCLTFDEINMVFIPFSFWNWKEVGGGVFKFVRHVLT